MATHLQPVAADYDTTQSGSLGRTPREARR